MYLYVTLAITKLIASLSRLLRKGGGQALPGLLAERLDPHLVGKLASRLPHGVILVTGTNGKTTTTRLLAEVLESNGEQVVTNSTGSNLKRGVTSALIAAADMSGGMAGTIGLFEVDEASLRLVAPEVKPQHIVVTNLFRDQLDRYGELDTTAKLIGEGILATSAELHLNADDPLVANLAQYAKHAEMVHFFGIEGALVNPVDRYDTAVDSDRCPMCRSRLIFSRIFYGHIGHYRCPKGDFARPRPRVAITNVEMADRSGSRFVLAILGRRSEFRFTLPGTYNLYNALAMVSVAQSLSVEVDTMRDVLASTRAVFGRMEQVEINGRVLCLLLVKNPAGFTQVLQTFATGQDGMRVMFVINDNLADGRDVSWLWDVPVEALVGHVSLVYVGGVRAEDMKLRLHYAGIESTSIQDLASGMDDFIAATPVGGTAYILPTYTALLELRKVLARRTVMQEMSR